MIEFVTLLLGLATGHQAVELSVDERVAMVEIRLDGRFVGGLTGPPWIVNCHFGNELAPHELVATAYDDRRQKLQTIHQWVNLPRERLEARLALDRPADGPATARLIWTALDHQEPPEVNISFDGQPLATDDLEAILLPAHDPRAVHFLRADLAFSSTVNQAESVANHAHAELVFGGSYGDEVSTELTALVLDMARASGDKRPPGPETMAGWLRKGEQALRVVAVDRGPVNLLVVRERSEATHERLRQRFEHFYNRHNMRRRAALGLPGSAGPAKPPAVLGRGDRVRFAYPTAGRRRMQVGQGVAPLVIEQVPVSHNVTDFGPLFDILTSAFSEEDETPVPRQQLADAVAIAGLVAATGDQRRAVLLIRSGTVEDSSGFEPTIVRGYLRRLGVPLIVWTLAIENDTASAWGEEHPVETHDQMSKALGELRKKLKSQVVIWVEGAHLSHKIELTEKAIGLRPVS